MRKIVVNLTDCRWLNPLRPRIIESSVEKILINFQIPFALKRNFVRNINCRVFLQLERSTDIAWNRISRQERNHIGTLSDRYNSFISRQPLSFLFIKFRKRKDSQNLIGYRWLTGRYFREIAKMVIGNQKCY